MFFAPLFKQKIGLLALLSFLAITCITFFKSALELEDAEQAYYSQWLRWGYDDQPPLYTWLQYAVNQVFGVQKGAFSVLRASIFAGILLSLWHFARRMGTNKTKSELAVLALVLMPVFIDFTFRRLSHTSLLCLAILASFIVLQRLLQKKSLVNYVLLGLVIGVGVLSKYNYVLFLGALGLALFFDKGLQKIIFNKKILVTVLLVCLLLSPHLCWLLGANGYLAELRESIALKTESNTQTVLYVIGPLFSLVLTLVKLMAPLLAVVGLAVVFKKVRFRKPKLDWLAKFAIAQSLVLLLFFTFLNVQKVEERWLLPLVLPYMVLLMRSMVFKMPGSASRYLFVLFLAVISVQVGRTPVEKSLGIPSSVHFGFEPLSTILNDAYANKQWMLPDVTYGGNIRILNPHKEVFSRDDFSLPSSKLGEIEGVEVVLGKESLQGRIPVETLVDFGKEKDTLFMVPLTE
ncbi:ArnT family glycosyltransferase [Maribacter chungangensis]|uniref:ArnT family glycosyltransferase n=1 Tax=Maribacter chungangensis TaxID=1069117 RepID=A0ABW3B478_9FLAO